MKLNKKNLEIIVNLLVAYAPIVKLLVVYLTTL